MEATTPAHDEITKSLPVSAGRTESVAPARGAERSAGLSRPAPPATVGECNTAHKLGRVEVQSRGQPCDGAQPRVALTQFIARDLRHVHAAFQGQIELGQAGRIAEPPKVDTELLLRLHEPIVGALGQFVHD
jgi:hypothetical protein